MRQCFCQVLLFTEIVYSWSFIKTEIVTITSGLQLEYMLFAWYPYIQYNDTQHHDPLQKKSLKCNTEHINTWHNTSQCFCQVLLFTEIVYSWSFVKTEIVTTTSGLQLEYMLFAWYPYIQYNDTQRNDTLQKIIKMQHREYQYLA